MLFLKNSDNILELIVINSQIFISYLKNKQTKKHKSQYFFFSYSYL